MLPTQIEGNGVIMQVERCIKGSFSVIGKEGSTADGTGFVPKLWIEANEKYEEVAALAKRDAQGHPLGLWGAMTNFARTNGPWENGFSEGYYLAGAEVEEDAQAPEGWVKWTIPAYEYLFVKVPEDMPGTFRAMISFLEENQLQLAGAVHEYYCPEEDGAVFLFFPIRKVTEEELQVLEAEKEKAQAAEQTVSGDAKQ